MDMTPPSTPSQALTQDAGAKARCLELLRRALEIVDLEGMPPAIGARLDHVICSIEELKD
jgi:hypothetical protein